MLFGGPPVRDDEREDAWDGSASLLLAVVIIGLVVGWILLAQVGGSG